MNLRQILIIAILTLPLLGMAQSDLTGGDTLNVPVNTLGDQGGLLMQNTNPQQYLYGNNAGSRSSGSDCGQIRNVGELFEFGICLLSGAVIPFIFGLAILLFLIGLIKYISAGDNEEKREAGRGMMVFGIIVLFVMVSIWGLVKILTNTFGFEFALPTLPKRATNPYAN